MLHTIILLPFLPHFTPDSIEHHALFKVDQPVKVDEWQSLLLDVTVPTENVDGCVLNGDGIDDEFSS